MILLHISYWWHTYNSMSTDIHYKIVFSLNFSLSLFHFITGVFQIPIILSILITILQNIAHSMTPALVEHRLDIALTSDTPYRVLSGHQLSRAPSKYRDCLSQVYGGSRAKDKTVARPSCLEHGDPYTGTTTSLYWYSPQLYWKYFE